MPSELSVIVKNDEKRQTTKHLIYEDYQVKYDDPIIAKCIEEAVKQFNAEPDDIKLKITMEIQ
jgi:hypothetical protein